MRRPTALIREWIVIRTMEERLRRRSARVRAALAEQGATVLSCEESDFAWTVTFLEADRRRLGVYPKASVEAEALSRFADRREAVRR